MPTARPSAPIATGRESNRPRRRSWWRTSSWTRGARRRPLLLAGIIRIRIRSAIAIRRAPVVPITAAEAVAEAPLHVRPQRHVPPHVRPLLAAEEPVAEVCEAEAADVVERLTAFGEEV